MVCFYPRRAPMIGGPKNIGYTPCGQCLACRINYRRVWTGRQLLEADGQSSWFVTLTYDNEHLPEVVQKREIQLFMKRIRKNTGIKLRYMACGEYGDKYGRPHYHLNLFGYKPDAYFIWQRNKNGKLVQIMQDRNIKKAWQDRGFHTIDCFTDSRASYVASYVLKKMKEKEDLEHPTFSLQSRKPGLGAEKFLKFCTTKKMTRWLAANPQTAEVPRVFERENKFWPVGHYLRKYVHEHTGIPFQAEIPVVVIVGQEKLKERYENPQKSDKLCQIMRDKQKDYHQRKKSTAHV